MTSRYFPEKLIPPGINDARTRAFLGAFEAMASEFDFTKLLMRNSSEMPTEVLPLAIAENSLEEFIDPDGSPEEAVRALIDLAFPLHETKGTDGGVLDALAAFDVQAHIAQWYTLNPPGPHDTHTITVDAGQDIFGDGDLWSARFDRQIWRIINAMKRWSQDTALRLSAMSEGRVYVGVLPVSHITVTALPLIVEPPATTAVMRMAVVPHTHVTVAAFPLNVESIQ